MERVALDYENLSHKYVGQNTSYNNQYCNIYLIRLSQMTKLLDKQIKKKWGDKYPVCKLHKLSEDDHSKCIVVGTLFKNQKLKPSILKQLAESNALVPQPIVTHFTDASDKLYVEDELQRYEIIGSLKCEDIVTGITCALLASNSCKGKIIVEDYVFAGCQPQIERPLLQDSVYVLLLSGLDFVHYENVAVNLQLLTHWLCDYFDNKGCMGSKVARVILAGNNIRTQAPDLAPSISMLSRKAEPDDTVEAVKRLDKFLVNLLKLIDVDLMPGKNDPSNHILPQKPLHPCMFTNSYQLNSLNLVTNPYRSSVGGVQILGHSGQPVIDVIRYSEIADPLQVLEMCLEWSHIAPTAPDTLGCFPFTENDPFIIEDCPHVFFAGNQDEFGTRLVTGPDGQKIRLICVPQFSKTFEAVLLDLKTLECKPVSFKTL